MAARIDVKNILSIFNESRLQADQNMQKERLAALNRELEERKMADEADYRNKSISVQRAEQEANARFREGSLAEQARQNDLTAERYKAEVAQQAVRDAALAQYYKDQIKLGYAGLNKEKDTAVSATQAKENAKQVDNQLRGNFQAEIERALWGGKNEQPLNIYGQPLDGVNSSDARAVSTRIGLINERLGKVSEIIEKYRLGGAPLDQWDLPVLTRAAEFTKGISGGNAYKWTDVTAAPEYSVNPSGVAGKFGIVPGFQMQSYTPIDQTTNTDNWNKLHRINSILSAFGPKPQKAS